MDFNGRAKTVPQLNITPLIDVVFLLLVFFMLTSSVEKRKIPVSLPASSSAVKAGDSLKIYITADGRILLDDREVSAASLRRLVGSMTRVRSEPDIEIASDAGCRVQDLVNVMDIVRQAGGRNVSITTAAE